MDKFKIKLLVYARCRLINIKKKEKKRKEKKKAGINVGNAY